MKASVILGLIAIIYLLGESSSTHLLLRDSGASCRILSPLHKNMTVRYSPADAVSNGGALPNTIAYASCTEDSWFVVSGKSTLRCNNGEWDAPVPSCTLYRPGTASNGHSCDDVTGVPEGIRTFFQLKDFYQKYTQAYGIPILGSSVVSDAALTRACYVVRFLLADRQDLRQGFYSKTGRAAIMAATEVTLDIPEHSNLPEKFNTRARGLGGTFGKPISTGAEENVLCLDDDRYKKEDIFVHEFAHSILNVALTVASPDFRQRLTAAFDNAINAGLWANTYASKNTGEYFAEMVQVFFNVQAPVSGSVHNDIDTREKLKCYDPVVYELLREVFPCENEIVDRCSNQGLINSKQLRMNCRYVPSNQDPDCTEPPPPPCVDDDTNCKRWADRGSCQANPNYMLKFCKLSCGVCVEQPQITPECFDDHSNCANFAARGECEVNPGWMLRNCRFSCRAC